MSLEIHFFDLDNTLWNIDTNIWIIHKNNPSVPILFISNDEYNKIINGVYHIDNNEINYNGYKYWISDILLEKIIKKRPAITIDDIGISFIERIDPKYFKNMKFYIDNIKHLIDTKVDIGILSGRFDVNADKLLLKTLTEELSKYNLDIKKFYYVSESISNKFNVGISRKKVNILLEHLVGYHIKDDKFISTKQDTYTTVHFYDDEHSNINYANDIQNLFNSYLNNSDNDVYNNIIKKIENNDILLYTHLISGNSLNKFKSTKIKLNLPIKYPTKIKENKILNYNEFINEGIFDLLSGYSMNEIKEKLEILSPVERYKQLCKLNLKYEDIYTKEEIDNLIGLEKYLTTTLYNKITFVTKDRAIILKNTKFGIINDIGEQLTPLKYDWLGNLTNNKFLRFNKGNKWGIIELYNNCKEIFD